MAVEPVIGPTPIGGLPGGDGSSVPMALSHDGTTAVGFANGPGQSGSQSTAFTWTQTGGMTGLPLPVGSSQAQALGVSPNGQHVVGWTVAPGARSGFVWTASSGLTLLADLPAGIALAEAYAVSADGSIVVGKGWNGTQNEAVRWVSGGPATAMGTLPGSTFGSFALVVTQDGSVAFGFSYDTADLQAVRFEAGGGVTPLGDIPGPRFHADRSTVREASADAQFLAGTGHDELFNEAVRWTPWEALPRSLGALGSSATPNGISDDGRVVVGDAGSRPFIWDAVHGMRDLETVLVDDYGVDLSAWFRLWSVRGLSGDGRTLLGGGTLLGGPGQGWILRLPPQCDDGLDNDGDGNIDHAADPDCTDASDNIEAPDTDGDWWLDAEDNCPTVSNQDQSDADGDTRGDACEHLTPVLRVPEDHATIQAALDAANHGDHIDVAPGVYSESIDFVGKRVELFSRDGPGATTIAGVSATEATVTFESDETTASALRGFTIRDGDGGVYIESGATVEDNVIEDNDAGFGGGIYVRFGDARILNNTIRSNHATVEGGGARMVGSTTGRVEFEGNRVEGNTAARGAGVAAREVAQLSIRDNRVIGNAATIEGGGMWLDGESDFEPLRVHQNLVAGNTAPSLPGLRVGAADGRSPEILQNTIATNTTTTFPGVAGALGVELGAAAPTIANNLFESPGQAPAVACDAAGSLFLANQFHSRFGDAWTSGCGLVDGQEGTRDEDPRFVGPLIADWRLLPESSAADSGDDATASPFITDLAGSPRFVDATGAGMPRVDRGAFELNASECDNGLDDDEDGATDAADPGCSSPGARYESPACDNGVDDDSDGLIDLADPGCASGGDGSEQSATLPCDNGLDDDSDGSFDSADFGCASPTWPLENPACLDGVDNDGDFQQDIDDPGCHTAQDTSEVDPSFAFSLSGTATGGSLRIDVAGRVIRVTTQAGETAAQVVLTAVNQLHADASLAPLGVTASANGAELRVSVPVVLRLVDDPGLLADPPPIPAPLVHPIGRLLVVLVLLLGARHGLRPRIPSGQGNESAFASKKARRA